MAPYEYKVTAEPAGHPGQIYHVRIWLRRPGHRDQEDNWTLVYERQIDAGDYANEPRKQWRWIMAQLSIRL